MGTELDAADVDEAELAGPVVGAELEAGVVVVEEGGLLVGADEAGMDEEVIITGVVVGTTDGIVYDIGVEVALVVVVQLLGQLKPML